MRIFVTGGSRGIGASLVLEAARAGWDVAFTYVREEARALEVRDQARESGGKVECYALDVRDPAAVDAVADAASSALGGIDAVVCNAGVSLNGLATSVSDDDWRTVIDTNLTGSFWVVRALLPELLANKGGRIVLVSSVTASGASGQAAYAASKAGLHGLAATLAKEYGPKGITANVVAPGYFDTDMTRSGLSDALSTYALKYCPARRLGELHELTRTILFLCGPDAAYVNGVVLPVTGGLDWAP